MPYRSKACVAAPVQPPLVWEMNESPSLDHRGCRALGDPDAGLLRIELGRRMAVDTDVGVHIVGGDGAGIAKESWFTKLSVPGCTCAERTIQPATYLRPL